MELPDHIKRLSDLEAGGKIWVPLTDEHQITKPVLACDPKYTPYMVWEFVLGERERIEYRVIYNHSGRFVNEEKVRQTHNYVSIFLGGRFHVLTNTCVFA